MTTAFIDTVAWDNLEHAYGAASDLPPLLKSVSTAKGRRMREPLGELYSRVLHQGTIYSASPPVAHAVIGMLGSAAPPEKANFYELLDGFLRSRAGRDRHGARYSLPCRRRSGGRARD